MFDKIVISILFLSLLAACAPAATSVPTEAAPTPYPTQDIPMPQATEQPKLLIAYPSPLDPVPNESKLTIGKAFVEKADLVSLESTPGQTDLVVSGSLPTPCHTLKASLKGPDDQNRIQVELYSLVQSDVVCAQVLKPFETNIPLGSLKSGKYTVSLNGNQVGEVTVP
jgi:hypothetical protein